MGSMEDYLIQNLRTQFGGSQRLAEGLADFGYNLFGLQGPAETERRCYEAALGLDQQRAASAARRYFAGSRFPSLPCDPEGQELELELELRGMIKKRKIEQAFEKLEEFRALLRDTDAEDSFLKYHLGRIWWDFERWCYNYFLDEHDRYNGGIELYPKEKEVIHRRMKGLVALGLVIGGDSTVFLAEKGSETAQEVFEFFDEAAALPENQDLVHRASLSIQSAWPFSNTRNRREIINTDQVSFFIERKSLLNLPDAAVACAVRRLHSLDQLPKNFPVSDSQKTHIFLRAARRELASDAFKYSTFDQKLDRGLSVLAGLQEIPNEPVRGRATQSFSKALLGVTNRVDDIEAIKKITGARISLEQMQEILGRSVHRAVKEVCCSPT